MKAMQLSLRYGLLMVLTIGLGLLSRSALVAEDSFVREYVGDGLWAMMVYWMFSALAPQARWRNRAMLALGFCICIELSQLSQMPWLLQARATTLGALVLGHSFSYADLILYSIGIGVATWLDRLLFSRRYRA